MNVAVIGYSGPKDSPPVSEISEICHAVGKLVAIKGHRLFTGGRDGVMELVSRGAAENGGLVVGILPFDEAGNVHSIVVLKTGLDYKARSLILVNSVDLVVSLGGEIGTLFEIVAAYGYGKDVILFSGTGGVTDSVRSILIDDRYLDNRRMASVYSVTDLGGLESFL